MDHSDLEIKCLELANNLIVRYAANSYRVSDVEDIDGDLIVFLFESITKHNIPDLLANENKETEAHNVQAVIDTLSMDLLGMSLSHITGEDVVVGNLVAIFNLLEVFEGMAPYFKPNIHHQRQNQNRIVKRKIHRNKKSSSSVSMKSLKSVPQVSPDIEARQGSPHIENVLQKKTNIDKTSSAPSSIKSLKSLVQDFPVVDASKQKQRDLSRPSASTYVAQQPPEIEKQDSYLSITKSELEVPLNSGSNIHLLTVDKHFSPDYPSSRATTSQHSQFQREKIEELKKWFHDQCANYGSSNNRDETGTDKRHVSTKEVPVIVDGNRKRKIKRLPKKENIKPSSSRSQEVEDLYEKNFETRVKGLLEKNCLKRRASQMKNMHLQSVRKPTKKFPISDCNKSFLLPHNLRRRSIAHNAVRRKADRKRSISQNITIRKALPESHKEGFLQELFDEFPELRLTPTVVDHITNKYQQHLLRMHKKVKAILLKKPKTQLQAEEAAKKQSLLNNIIKKDIQQQQHLQELKEYKMLENKMKYKLRDARLQSAKMKQYCDEFQTEMRKKMQKRNYSEELVFENLFKESLKIQKEQVDYLCQEVKDSADNDAKKHLVYLDALENLYQTQFAMLSESLVAEKKDAQVKAKAEQQEMNAMQREFQDELKDEIRFMQKVIVDFIEDIHFREMDAEQFKEKLRKRQ